MKKSMCCLVNLKFFIIILLNCILFSCSYQESKPVPMTIPEDIGKILVVSFQDLSTKDSSGVRCTLSGKTFMTGFVEKDAAQFLNDYIKILLNKNHKYKFISSEQLQNFESQILSHNEKKRSEREILAAAASKLGADAVLAGHIYRFKDREGGKYSVKSPASVAFDLHFLRVSDGRILWSGHFDETQQALTDNLFNFSSFLKRDGQWVTAQQMAGAGLEKMLEALNLP